MLRVPEVDRFQINEDFASPAGATWGAFLVSSPEPGWVLLLIIGDAHGHPGVPGSVGWEHVSVSARERRRWRERTRTPTWREMAHVKELCWDDEDVVVQFHPRRSEYVNEHPHCLHLWRYTLGAFPTPSPNLVGRL